MFSFLRFGEHTMLKVVNWLENTELVNKTSEIIDVGCGNGMTLVELVCATVVFWA